MKIGGCLGTWTDTSHLISIIPSRIYHPIPSHLYHPISSLSSHPISSLPSHLISIIPFHLISFIPSHLSLLSHLISIIPPYLISIIPSHFISIIPSLSGKCFEFAIGTETNLKTAVKYYVLAAEQGGCVGAVVASSLPSRDFCCDTMIIYLQGWLMRSSTPVFASACMPTVIEMQTWTVLD